MRAAPLTGLLLLIFLPRAEGRELMRADGPLGMDTYQLLRRSYTIEPPDCAHAVPHITEVFDQQLGKDVFVFALHINQDNDRCINFDRQRNEIRGRTPGIVARENETVYYRWKFKLPAGFQTSANFCHIFQIKSDLDPPIVTLTPRRADISIGGRIGDHGTARLDRFIGQWVAVDLTILYSHAGRIDMTIRHLPDNEVLFAYAGAADTWDDNAGAHDPKWGLYRSLASTAVLRDEQISFADFCVSKVNATECLDENFPPPGEPPPPPPPAAPATDAGAPPAPVPPPAPATTATDAAPPPPPPGPPPSIDGEETSPPPPTTPPGPTPRPAPPGASPGTMSPSGPPGARPPELVEGFGGTGACSCHLGSRQKNQTPAAGVLILLGAAAALVRHRRRTRRPR